MIKKLEERVRKLLKIQRFFLMLTLLCSGGINAATLFVESLDDALGTTATLRQTIIDASGGDTIQFNVSGTIFLDEALGELVVDKELIIDGQNKIVVDGKNQINICFHLTGGSASDSVIQNITIQNFNGHEVDPGSGTASQELPAYGIFIDGNAEDCSVINTTIKNIHSGISQNAAGVRSDENTNNLLDNTINNISSEPANISGLVAGIGTRSSNAINNNTITDLTSGAAGFSSGDVNGVSCLNILSLLGNSIANIFSGVASGSSGFVSGVIAGNIQNIENNTFKNLTSGIANISGQIEGIAVSSADNITNNKISNLTSGDAQNSGNIFGISVTIDIDENCLNNSIATLGSGMAQNNSGFVRGIFIGGDIDGNCSNNNISHLTGGQAGNNSQAVTGILIEDTLGGNCLNNTILYLTSGVAGNTSGIVGGIFGFGTYEGNVSNNTIQYLTTSNAGQNDQHAMGIFVNQINGDCLNNLVTDVSISGAITIERSGGIRFSFVDDGGLLACNTILRITGGQDGLTFGMEIEEGNNLTIRNNTIDFVVDSTGPAHGLFLGSDVGSVGFTFVTNSFVSFNTISNITGNSLNGFGITIFGDESVGNDLLNNSIFDINGKAINIIDNGVPVDATITLQSAVCGANKIIIRGTVEPEPGFEESEFVVQFFASNSSIPPQTMTFIGETTIQADDTTPFMVEIKACLTDTTGYLTATATALPLGTAANNNTSEVSNAIPGCDSSTICSLLCTPVPTPAACPA